MVATMRKRKRSLRRAQPVANAGFGEDILRTLGIGFDLLPELADIDPQILGVGQIIPKLAEQKFMREHFAGVLHQNAQQIVFLRRKFYLPLSDLDVAANQIDREFADFKNRPLAMRL